jgi:hypothetical protein
MGYGQPFWRRVLVPGLAAAILLETPETEPSDPAFLGTAERSEPVGSSCVGGRPSSRLVRPGFRSHAGTNREPRLPLACQ